MEIAGDNGKTFKTHALLDDGADKSMCDERLLKILDIESRPVTFKVTTMTSNEDTVSGNEVNLHVGPVNGHESFPMPKVWSVKRLPILTKSAAPKCAVEKYDYLADLSLPEIDNDDVMLLIGSDAPFAHIPLEVRAGRNDQPYAIRSSLGWAVRGPLGADTEMVTKSASIGYHCVQEVSTEQRKRKLSTDFDKVMSNDKCAKSDRYTTILESTILHEDVKGNVNMSQPEVTKTGERDLDIDHSFTSVSQKEVVPLATNIQSSLKHGEFRVRKWKHNKWKVFDSKQEPEVTYATSRAKRNAKLQSCRIERDKIDTVTRTQDREWIGWTKRPPDIQTMYNGRDGEKRLI